MTKTLKHAGGLALAFALLAQPLSAQTRPAAAAAAPAAPRAQIAPGVAVANLDAAIENTNAYRAGVAQAQNLYKPAIDAYQAKGAQYAARLKTMYDQLNADITAKKPEAVLQQQYNEIKKLEAQREEDLAQTIKPLVFSMNFMREQIEAKLSQAVQNVASKRGITLLLRPETIYFAAPAYDITAAVVQELNVLVPTVQISPPAGWLPRELREQQAQQQPQAQQPAQPRPAGAAPAAPAPRPASAPAPRPAGPQPEGR
ncbi:MAG: OmpH family outer membrane protein [Novosphingobium sp.]|uniref:OmpH family outer membrane protein n=1 Tax=Novosphingobium sp. TaxID=1874826 RepID=UPI0032BB7D62